MIRDRDSDDLQPCIELLAEVHGHDRYPLHWPTDPYRWLSPRDLLHAWVATAAGATVVGHLAVRGSAGSAEVCRLFVAPAFRRDRVATRLLEQVRRWAADRGIDLMLEVVDTERSPAVALYERTGWQHTDTETAKWTDPDGGPVTLLRYTLPGATGPR